MISLRGDNAIFMAFNVSDCNNKQFAEFAYELG